MATLKDYLRSMGLRSGMEGSGPSTSTSIALADNTDGFVPPCDGYLHFRGELDSLDKWLTMFQLDYGRSYDIAGTSPLEDVVRVRKGIPVRFSSKEGMKIKDMKFFKCIGGGHSRYLPTLSCNRFGGALWLRLKTTSETLPRLVAGSRSRLSVASSSRASHLHLAREIASTCRQQTVFASFGLRVPVSTLRFANPVAHNLSRQTVLQAGRKLVFLVPVDKSSTMRLGVRSSEGSSTSFLLSVASNNARMEVAA